MNNKEQAVIDTTSAFIDQLNCFNNFYHPEVHKKALELSHAVGNLYK